MEVGTRERGEELKTSAQVPGFCYIFFDVTNLRLIVNRSYEICLFYLLKFYFLHISLSMFGWFLFLSSGHTLSTTFKQ